MQYELLDPSQRRQMLTDRLRTEEAQHYNEVLRKIANPKDRATQQNVNDNLAKMEAGIAALRAELATYDDEQPKQLVDPVVDEPAPAQVTSAVHGDVSEPQTDTPST